MKQNTKSSILNILIATLFLGSSSYFAWQFWKELTRTVKNTDGVVIGEIVDIKGRIQRRYDRQSRWEIFNGKERKDIFNLDSIRTSPDSGAVIYLDNTDAAGNEFVDTISLGSDTYIFLDISEKTRNIHFSGGNISATGSSGLTISTEGIQISADNGSVSLSKIEGQQTSITVTEGTATVKTKNGSSVVGRDAVLHIDEATGTETREQLAFSAIEPKSSDLLLTYGKQRQVNFSWNLYEDWGKTTLEISSESSFNDSDADVFRVDGNSGTTFSLSSGLWYWRVKDASSGQESIAVNVNEFIVGTTTPVKPVSPAPDSLILFRRNTPPVTFRWNQARFADSYRLELSRTASFAKIALQKEVSENLLLVNSLSPGEWWWRVTPLYQRGILDKPPVVQPGKFTLELKTGHEPIVLITPKNDASFSPQSIRTGIPFRWKDQDGMASYQIKISSDQDMKTILVDSHGADNWTTLLPPSKPGTYYWQIEAVADDSLPVPVSAIHRFTVRPLTGSVELIDPSPEGIEPYSIHTFRWKSKIPGTAHFLLEHISSDTEKKRTRLIDSLVNGESFTSPLTGAGQYIWKVQILDQNARVRVQSTEASFVIHPELTPPLLNTPKPGSSISLIGLSSLSLSWNPVTEADAYKVMVKAPDGTIISQDNHTTRLTREIASKKFRRTGVYTVELISVRKNPPPGAPQFSSTASFHFDVGALVQYSAVQPISPANGSSITALSSMKKGITLKWSQNPPLGHYTVELDDGRLTRLYQTDRTSLTLKSLTTGTYSWIVKSMDQTGQEAPESQSSHFTINELITPPPPVAVSPTPDEDIDMTHQRKLVFIWKPAKGADLYDLALYAQGSESPILEETDITGTQYTLNNLRILDEGGFVLTIQARKEYRDVGVTRKSPILRIPFSLSVNITKKVPKILTNELQYVE